ncbi:MULTISPECIES: polysaccharide lyase 8 family protein [unclassified Streptomyces]|uniref:polysaccharide lyase 8 family protein n=1 Tax=unclassified Streptomyces TaxID=2593676 RepID=UPI002E12BB3F|nr:polysaccharide lyase 8 family protein [Streptomyces sp. NBC_01197]WSS52747.1 polysaccharide lyase 8 family protein [Streptomyces sp. NBC_01180]
MDQHRSALSRRTLLAAGAASVAVPVIAGAAGSGTAQAAARTTAATGSAADTTGTTDMYEAALARAEQLITGGEFDASDPDFAAALATLDASAADFWKRLDRTAARTALWPDYVPVTDPGMFSQSYTRLRTLATAWATTGAALNGSVEVADALVSALRFLHDTAYNPDKRESGNWWFWEIGAPRALLDNCVLLRTRIPADDLAAHLASVEKFAPNPDRRTNSPTLAETGANRADKCVITALHGLLSRDSAKVALARDGLSDVRDKGLNSLFQEVTSGDGFYADGSFIQHDAVAYTGSYGTVLLGGAAYMSALLAGSPWAVSDPHISVMYEAVTGTFSPVIFDGLMMDAVRGRAISRERAADHTDGAAAVSAILLLASAAPASVADSWRATVKGWIERNRTDPYLGLVGIPQVALAKELLADRSVTAAERVTGHHVFADMDRVVHRRPGWSMALSLSSKRIAAYEAGNGENLHGWYTGDGMAYLYTGDDLGQFGDGFWPTVDPYRLPGTTVDTRRRADITAGGYYLPGNTVAGGAVLDGRYGAAAMELAAQGSTLRARKSWFLVDNAVIALGAGITASDGRTIETVVENRNLHTSGEPRLTVDGRRQPSGQGWSGTFDGAHWAHLDGVGGYVFPSSGTSLKALREERTGRWSDLDTGADTAGSATPVTRRYATLWLDHGVSPTDASYAYILLPGASAAATAVQAHSRPVRIVANNATAQLVEVGRTGLTAATFWQAGTAAGLTASGPASVLLRRHGGGFSVAVADPGHDQHTLTLELPFRVREVVRADGTVTVATGRRPVLTITVAGSRGHTHTAELR